MGAGIAREFVVATPNVLHERVTAHDHTGAVVAFESAHRSEPRLEPSVVDFDPIVRVLLSVVERGRHQLIHDGEECPGPIGHYFRRLTVRAERSREEPSRSVGIASG